MGKKYQVSQLWESEMKNSRMVRRQERPDEWVGLKNGTAETRRSKTKKGEDVKKRFLTYMAAQDYEKNKDRGRQGEDSTSRKKGNKVKLKRRQREEDDPHS